MELDFPVVLLSLALQVEVCIRRVGMQCPLFRFIHINLPWCASSPLQVEVCIKRLRMDAPELAAALNRIDTDKLKVRSHGVTGPRGFVCLTACRCHVEPVSASG
jgi:hypothetical protein